MTIVVSAVTIGVMAEFLWHSFLAVDSTEIPFRISSAVVLAAAGS